MTFPSIFLFDPTAFKVEFPAFSADPPYSDAYLQMFWDIAINYISNCNYGSLNDGSRLEALNLMTAHLLQLSVLVAAGQTPQVVSSSAIDKISVGLVPPPVANRSYFLWWLSTTPYGMKLAALLGIFAVGGFMIGGLPEKSAFRKIGGIF